MQLNAILRHAHTTGISAAMTQMLLSLHIMSFFFFNSLCSFFSLHSLVFAYKNVLLDV